jgi:hypothetical protein
MIGPESLGWSQPLHAPNACAWMPKPPGVLQGGGFPPLPVPQVTPLTEPAVCVQSILIGCKPSESLMAKLLLPFGVQTVPVLLGLRLMLAFVLVSTAVTVASPFLKPLPETLNATTAWGCTLHADRRLSSSRKASHRGSSCRQRSPT